MKTAITLLIFILPSLSLACDISISAPFTYGDSLSLRSGIEKPALIMTYQEFPSDLTGQLLNEGAELAISDGDEFIVVDGKSYPSTGGRKLWVELQKSDSEDTFTTYFGIDDCNLENDNFTRIK